MKLKCHFPILAGHQRYLGALFAYETEDGLRWSHSLLNHGSPLFKTSVEATEDFHETKLRLPSYVHDTIFGTSDA